MREVKVGWLVACVDDRDYLLVGQYSWSLDRQETANSVRWYARRRWRENGRRRSQFMHQLILGVRGVDHMDHDGLNNQRSNLRLASAAQNQMNRRVIGREGMRGLWWDESSHGWRVRIRDGQGNRRSIGGTFVDPVEAARAYDAAARELHGEFALLNFPV